MKKRFTIWRYYLIFGSSMEVFKDRNTAEFDTGFVYIGKTDEIPTKIAEKIAELHINIYDYFESAMMPLYKGYGKLKSGTGDPTFAIKSRCNLPFVYIKEIFDDKDCYPSK